MAAFERLLSPRTRIVSVSTFRTRSHDQPGPPHGRAGPRRGRGGDGRRAQAVPHLAVDVREIGCDFYAFSGTRSTDRRRGRAVRSGRPPRGHATLAGRRRHDRLGDVREIHLERAAVQVRGGDAEHRGTIALGAAIDWVDRVGIDAIAGHEEDLLRHGTRRLEAIPGLRIVGTARQKTGVLSFVVEGVHPHDVGTILDHEGIAVRTGHHCAQPVMDRYGLPATTRASLACFNTREELDALAAGIRKVQRSSGDRGGLGAHGRDPGAGEPPEWMIYGSCTRRSSSTTRSGLETCGGSRTRIAGGGTQSPLRRRATVYLQVEGGVVRDVSFEGSGCSISTASASMMTDALKGKTVAEAEALFARFHDLVTADPSKAATAAAELGKLAVFAGSTSSRCG